MNEFFTPTDESLACIAQEKAVIRNALEKRYETPYGAFYSPSDQKMINQVMDLAAKIKQNSPTLLMLVGIGGSSMTTQAVYRALYGTEARDQSLRFYCADTIDDAQARIYLSLFEQELSQGNEVVLCIVTKSGTTTETIMNAALFFDCLKKWRPHNYKRSLVTITDNGSPLWNLAQSEEFDCLEIQCAIGGRFSAFSPAALLPLALLNIDINAFCVGARRALAESLESDSAAEKTAAQLFQGYSMGCTNHNFFAFSPDLIMLGNWYKQLIGESLGKKETCAGNQVNVGITPTVSIGTTDLHSVAQLYLAGPYNTITSFVSFAGDSSDYKIPNNEIGQLLPGLVGKTITEVKSAIFKGTIAAYKHEKRPLFVSYLERTSESLGAFMMIKMCETIFLARLFAINPFDQPAVELYKKQTRFFLREQSEAAF
jgi:glucose-6-phosphate isomerase